MKLYKLATMSTFHISNNSLPITRWISSPDAQFKETIYLKNNKLMIDEIHISPSLMISFICFKEALDGEYIQIC